MVSPSLNLEGASSTPREVYIIYTGFASWGFRHSVGAGTHFSPLGHLAPPRIYAPELSLQRRLNQIKHCPE
jgi:hypothetical protein